MKRKELISISQNLSKLSELKGVKFSYTLMKNKKKIDEELKLIEELVKPSEDYQAFDRERVQLCELHAIKDEAGKPVMIDGVYQIDSKEQFGSEIENLKTKHSKAVDEYESQIVEYNRFIEEDVQIEFWKLSEKDIPSDISLSQLALIDWMIDYES